VVAWPAACRGNWDVFMDVFQPPPTLCMLALVLTLATTCADAGRCGFCRRGRRSRVTGRRLPAHAGAARIVVRCFRRIDVFYMIYTLLGNNSW